MKVLCLVNMAVGGLESVIDFYSGAALNAIAEKLLDIIEYLGLNYQNESVEAGGKGIINCVFHQYLVVGTETFYLLNAAVA